MNPLRIGLVRRGHSATGGAERFLERFADAIARTGHTPVLFGSPDWPTHRRPAAFVEVPGSGPVRFADALDALRPKTHCDLLFSLERVWHCDAYRAGDGVHRAWLERRKAFEPRWQSWTHALRPLHRELLALERAVFDPARTRHVIANAAFVADEIAAAYPFPRDRITVVPNGLPGDWIDQPLPDRHEARRQLGLPPAATLGLFLGSGWTRKGLPTALAAAGQLEPDGFQLVVAGRGPRRRHASGRALFAGPVADPRPWFAACDLFVLPTWYDPFSNACLEAAACGLPVLTTRANGFSEILEPGRHGESLANPGDADALAEAIRTWCDPERRRTARPHLLELARRHTIERNVQQTLAALGL